MRGRRVAMALLAAGSIAVVDMKPLLAQATPTAATQEGQSVGNRRDERRERRADRRDDRRDRRRDRRDDLSMRSSGSPTRPQPKGCRRRR